MANVQYPAGQGAPAHAALPVAQEIQPADELPGYGAQAVGGQVAQVGQRVDRQEALPAAEHVVQEIQPAAAQVPQQAMEQVQQGELEVEYVYFEFCRLRIFSVCLFINCKQGRGRQPFICFPFACFRFSRPFSVRVLVSLSLAVKFISTILVYFPRLTTIYCQHEGRAFICGLVIWVQTCYSASCKN